jgi:glycerophosphoryl diester phosphodiesterase
MLLFILTSCGNSSKQQKVNLEKYAFDLQAHRGGASIYPENSMEAFQQAIELEVTTLELDVVVSKDSMVVVSHEPVMRPGLCKTPQGDAIESKTEFNLYEMTYDEIKAFDCGSLPSERFPDRKNLKTYKPLLSEVIQMTTSNLRARGTRVSLNIELKSSPETDNIYHPEPEEFVRLVLSTIKNELIPIYKITLQSFDERIIREINEKYPMFQTAYLVEEGNVFDNITSLNSVPKIYSPYYKLLDSLQVKQAHDMGMKVIPWTVNEFKDMQMLLDMGVDGIITDYPNIAKALHK